VIKSLSIGLAALTDIILEFGGEAILMQLLKLRIKDSPRLHAFCVPSKQKVLVPFISTERAVTGTVYLDMLKKVIVRSNLQKGMLFLQDGTPPFVHWNSGETS
jgi:hypothetical protein